MATINGIINWTDSNGGLHAVRQSTVNIFDADTDQIITTVSTNITGYYSATFNNSGDFYVEVVADSPFHFVQQPNNSSTYSYTTDVVNQSPNGVSTLDIEIGNQAQNEQAFSVSDALYTSGIYAQFVRGTPAVLPANFPIPGLTSFYSPSDKDINIASRRRGAWDVIQHEYGHFLADLDNLDLSPGGPHSFGVSNIASRGKLNGVRLAWGEGLASYLGISSQHVVNDLGFLPNVPTVGDTFYDSIDADNPNNSFSVDLETNIGSGNAGEGDEAPVMRILWDLADGKNEAHDQIALGHVALYDILNNQISNLDQLDDVWDYFFNISNDAERTQYGAIFEEYDVAPAPFNEPIDDSFYLGGTTPTFEWAANNNNANDQFQVLIFNSDFSVRLLESPILNDMTQWTPNQAEWNSLLNNSPGEYNFIVAGSDTNDFTTGSYWSGAYSFEVVRATNLIVGTSNNDTLFGTVGDDTIDGLAGNDMIFGSEGVNTLLGGDGDDTIYGGSQDDVIRGGIGNDTIYASEGNNDINGGTGDDIIYSGSGNDFIESGSGFDTLWLGGGEDLIVLEIANGFDTINNFQLGLSTFDVDDFNQLSIIDGINGAEISQAGDLLAIVSWTAAGILNNNLSEVFV
ncbi:MAG: calcium-binding protein [Symploca sp. SIO1A3]|nr:calcium-binding protein [Symploca sp. SIO1A3]